MTVPSTSTANSVGQNAIDLVDQEYPTLSWMLNIPELAQVIINAAQQGPNVPQADIQNAIQNTAWWQTQSTNAKAFFAEEMSGNIVDAQNMFQAQVAQMSQTFGQLGLNPTQNQLQIFAWESLVNGWNTAQALQAVGKAMVINPDGSISFQADQGLQTLMTTTNAQGQTIIEGIQTSSTPNPQAAPGSPQTSNGQLQSLEQNFQSLAKQYLVNMSPGQIGQWVQNAVIQGMTGQQASQGFQAYLQTTALAQYPWMAQGIQAGQTPLTLVSPYANMLSSELGINPNNIDWTQPQYAKLLSTPDPKTGTPTQTPIWQATQTVRSDPNYNWSNTPNGLSAQYSFVQGLQETLGQRSYSGVTPGAVAMPQAYGSSGG